MKKLLLLAVVCCSTVAFAQRVNISTWNTTDLKKYDGQEKNISMMRYVFTGWNTVCVPFAMTEAQINELFGEDCKVEALVGVEGDAQNINVFFDDVKINGIEANKPYLVYVSKDSKYVNAKLDNVKISAHGAETISFTSEDGTVVAMSGTYSHIAGLNSYGILAKDNSETKFVPVAADLNGFYPTRCFLTVNGTNSAKVNAFHGEPAKINSLSSSNTQKSGDTYDLRGIKVSDSHKGIIIRNGKKYIK